MRSLRLLCDGKVLLDDGDEALEHDEVGEEEPGDEEEAGDDALVKVELHAEDGVERRGPVLGREHLVHPWVREQRDDQHLESTQSTEKPKP